MDSVFTIIGLGILALICAAVGLFFLINNKPGKN